MGRPIGPKKVHRYSVEFKLTAVKLSGMPGVQVQTAANALDIRGGGADGTGRSRLRRNGFTSMGTDAACRVG